MFSLGPMPILSEWVVYILGIPDAETRFRIAQIDSNTLKLRNKLYPSVYQGDLNIYGYNEGDVPVFPDSAYAYRLSLLETEIPLEYNQHVRAYIDFVISYSAQSSFVFG